MFDPDVLPLVVRAGAGSVRDSLSVLDQLVAGSDESGLTYERAIALLGYTDATLLDEITDAFAAADGASVFQVVNRIVEGGHEPRRFAADMLDHFRDLIVLAAVPDAGQTGLLDLPPDRLDLMSRQAERSGAASLTRAAEIMSNGLDQMRGATSPRLLLELMCAQVLLPSASTDEKAFLARLERLERGGGLASAPQPGPQHVPGPPAPAPGRPRPAGSAESPAGWPGAGQAPAPGTVPAARPPHAGGPGTPAPGRPRPAGDDVVSRPAPAAAGPAARADNENLPPDASPAGAAAASGAEQVSRNWDAILDAIKRERRVAWMLLSNATVVSLDDGVLTLRFARDGDVKGFTTSGCDADLKRVLAAQFGLSVRIRALSANDPAAGGREPRPRLNAVPDQPAARPDGGGGRESAAGPSHPDAAGGGEDAGNIPGQDRPVSAGAGSPAPSAGGHGVGSNAVSTGPDASPAGDTPGAPAANRRSAATASPAAGGSPASQPASSGPARPGAGSRSAGGQPAGRAGFGPGVEEAIDIPDAEDIASPGQAGISGMDLIQRELGGQIIGEIKD